MRILCGTYKESDAALRLGAAPCALCRAFPATETRLCDRCFSTKVRVEVDASTFQHGWDPDRPDATKAFAIIRAFDRVSAEWAW